MAKIFGQSPRRTREQTLSNDELSDLLDQIQQNSAGNPFFDLEKILIGDFENVVNPGRADELLDLYQSSRDRVIPPGKGSQHVVDAMSSQLIKDYPTVDPLVSHLSFDPKTLAGIDPFDPNALGWMDQRGRIPQHLVDAGLSEQPVWHSAPEVFDMFNPMVGQINRFPGNVGLPTKEFVGIHVGDPKAALERAMMKGTMDDTLQYGKFRGQPANWGFDAKDMDNMSPLDVMLDIVSGGGSPYSSTGSLHPLYKLGVGAGDRFDLTDPAIRKHVTPHLGKVSHSPEFLGPGPLNFPSEFAIKSEPTMGSVLESIRKELNTKAFDSYTLDELEKRYPGTKEFVKERARIQAGITGQPIGDVEQEILGYIAPLRDAGDKLYVQYPGGLGYYNQVEHKGLPSSIVNPSTIRDSRAHGDIDHPTMSNRGRTRDQSIFDFSSRGPGKGPGVNKLGLLGDLAFDFLARSIKAKQDAPELSAEDYIYGPLGYVGMLSEPLMGLAANLAGSIYGEEKDSGDKYRDEIIDAWNKSGIQDHTSNLAAGILAQSPIANWAAEGYADLYESISDSAPSKWLGEQMESGYNWVGDTTGSESIEQALRDGIGFIPGMFGKVNQLLSGLNK